MIRVITITHQCGSGGTQLASLIARKFGWELLDHHLVDRIARIADLDVAKAAQFDEQAARWWRGLRPPRINLADCCPYVSPRWLDAVDEDSAHALATQLIQAAAHFVESASSSDAALNACCRAEATSSMFLSMHRSRNESGPCKLAGLNTETFKPCSRRWIHNEPNIFANTTGEIGLIRCSTIFASALRSASIVPPR
jgi:hypothetical protein